MIKVRVLIRYVIGPPEKAALFQRRYEEGYDVPDDEYMKWVRENHPESVPDQATYSHDCNDLANQGNSDGLSLYQTIRFAMGNLHYHLKRQHFFNEGTKKGMIYLMMSI